MVMDAVAYACYFHSYSNTIPILHFDLIANRKLYAILMVKHWSHILTIRSTLDAFELFFSSLFFQNL